MIFIDNIKITKMITFDIDQKCMHKYNIYTNNFMANFENKVNVHDNASVTNWISQINAGGTTYDIATHHSIKFVEGSEETTWNGLTDLTVVIPTIEDIVQTPIEFAGTVTADETISWIEPHGKDNKAEVGNLVFITVDCTFAGKACEAGDMAIYDGEGWNIVSGENQVELKGTTDKDNRITVAVGAASDVLSVEGKTLALTLDYTDLDKHVSVTRGGSATAPVKFGNMTVGTKYVKLNKDADVSTKIGSQTSIKEAKSLANGDVTINGTDDLVTGVTFGTFDAGSLQEIVLNSDKRTFDVTGGSLTQIDDHHFVKDVTLGKVTFGGATAATEGAFTLVNGIASATGQSFVTGISGKNEFTVAGCLQPTAGANAKFVTNTGNYVTGLNAGSFTLTSGDALVTGFTTETDEKGDVISSVEVSANNNTSVLNEAKVENHVLSFGETNVASSVTVIPKYKSLTKTGFTYTDPTVKTTAFTTGGFTQASDVKYTFDTAGETTYTTTTSYYKISTPELEKTYGGYKLNNTGMVANVAENTFAVNVTGGVLPSLTNGSVSRQATITGTVSTALDFDDKTFNALDSTSINMPGAYRLSVDNTSGDIAVGAEGALAAKSATIDLSTYVTDVAISESAVKA
jgi:hypothetical protein